MTYEEAEQLAHDFIHEAAEYETHDARGDSGFYGLELDPGDVEVTIYVTYADFIITAKAAPHHVDGVLVHEGTSISFARVPWDGEALHKAWFGAYAALRAAQTQRELFGV